MNTPAGVLANILEAASKKPDSRERLIKIVANDLGIEGDEGEQIALLRLRGLTLEAHTLIDKLPFDDSHKAIARQNLTPLGGFQDFSAFSHSIAQSRNPLLQPGTISNLRSLDMILMQVAHAKVITEDAKLGVERFREMMNSIHDQSIPDELKKAVLHRMQQVIEALDHFEFLGETNLSLKVDALLGQVLIAEAAQDGKSKKYFKNVVATVGFLAAALITGDQAVEAYLRLTNSIPKIAGLLPAPDVSEAE